MRSRRISSTIFALGTRSFANSAIIRYHIFTLVLHCDYPTYFWRGRGGIVGKLEGTGVGVGRGGIVGKLEGTGVGVGRGGIVIIGLRDGEEEGYEVIFDKTRGIPAGSGKFDVLFSISSIAPHPLCRCSLRLLCIRLRSYAPR